MKADNTKTTIKQIAALIAIFGMITGLFYLLFEIREEQVDKGYTRAARSNPFHAATLFLNQTGTQTTVIKGFKEFEDLSHMDGTIIISDSRRYLSREQNKKLLDWVKAGGSLILFAEPPKKSSSWMDAFSNNSKESSTDDLVLSSVGAEVYKVESDAKADQVEEEPGSKSNCHDMNNLDTTACVELKFKGNEKPLYVEFSTWTAIKDNSGTVNASVGSKKGLHLLQYDFEEGLLTLVTDMDFWTNQEIHKNDHAFLLESFTENSSHVWFMSHGRSLSFLELIWKYAYLLILWLVLVLVLFLWRKSFRFGPILPDSHPASRKLMEHVTASSRFLWRKKRESYMIQQLQDYVDRRMKKKQPGYTTLNKKEQLEAVHRLTHLTRSQIQQAFQARSRYSKSEFLKTIQALQKIGQKL